MPVPAARVELEVSTRMAVRPPDRGGWLIQSQLAATWGPVNPQPPMRVVAAATSSAAPNRVLRYIPCLPEPRRVRTRTTISAHAAVWVGNSENLLRRHDSVERSDLVNARRLFSYCGVT